MLDCIPSKAIVSVLSVINIGYVYTGERGGPNYIIYIHMEIGRSVGLCSYIGIFATPASFSFKHVTIENVQRQY